MKPGSSSTTWLTLRRMRRSPTAPDLFLQIGGRLGSMFFQGASCSGILKEAASKHLTRNQKSWCCKPTMLSDERGSKTSMGSTEAGGHSGFQFLNAPGSDPLDKPQISTSMRPWQSMNIHDP
mmetsp:Transcript_99356/g.176948  ORF Transcript_99356/g.176948 Transcript_99356/m.176948 type:complete len:122 (-) Transcript_99356:114-479(-)